MRRAPQIVAFADLDDTLFQTLRKLPGQDPAALTPQTLDTRGEAHSYSTPAQVALLDWLGAAGATLIPVTGRDEEALARVRLALPSWRVLNHGLTLQTPAGEPDPEWSAEVARALEPLQAPLREHGRWMEERARALGCRLRTHTAQGLPFMLVLKHPEADPGPLAELQDAWAARLGTDSGLQVIANANNVSLLPAHIGKAAAVRFLRRREFGEADLVLGLGDSLSDLGFLAECDFALTPAQGQLLRAVLAAGLRQR